MSDIPGLKLSKLRKLIKRFSTSPQLHLMNLFGEDKWESEDVDWEGQIGNRGMTPFGSENVPAPIVSPDGVSDHAAKAAYWHEKVILKAHLLNNLRKAGTILKEKAEKYVTKQAQMLRNRCDRRKEWMLAQMLTVGKISYLDAKMQRINVDYGIPDEHKITLASNLKWNQTGAKIVEDIMDASITMSNANCGKITHAFFTSEVLKHMVLNTSIQTLLQKSSFGSGDLFIRPKETLGALLHIPNMMQYDEKYVSRAYLTANLSSGAGPHTIYVDETQDFVVGATIYLWNTLAKKTEALTISAVSAAAGTITATGTLTRSYRAIMDYVQLPIKFIPTNTFTLLCDQIEGQKVAEFAQAPFGLEGTYGRYVDAWQRKDPDASIVRVQNKGLPVLYFEDCIYQLTVL